MPPLTQEELKSILEQYITGTNISDISKQYSKTEATIKTNIKKYVSGLIVEGQLDINEASTVYRFSIPELQKSVSFRTSKESVTPLPSTPISLSTPLFTPISLSTPTPVLNDSNIYTILKEIGSKLDTINSEIVKLRIEKDRQLENSTEIIQKLIKSKDPEKIVQEIRNENKINGTEYVEPIRPQVPARPAKILAHNEFFYKIRADFNQKDLIKKVYGSVWFPGTSKADNGWLVPINAIKILEKNFNEANVPFSYDLTEIPITTITDDIIEQIDVTEIGPGIFL